MYAAESEGQNNEGVATAVLIGLGIAAVGGMVYIAVKVVIVPIMFLTVSA